MTFRLPIPSMDGLTTERLVFRRPMIGDVEWWMEYMRDAQALRFMAFRVGSTEDGIAFVQRSLDRIAKDGSGLNVVSDRRTGKPMGMVGLLTQEVDGTTELEIGYHLVPSAWGKGHALDAAKACKEFAKERRLAPSVISLIDPQNVRSQRVAIRNGMLPEKVSVHRGHDALVFRHTFQHG